MATWHFKETREHYAALYNVSPRTISRYAKAGYPLDDEPHCRALIAGQRTSGTNEPVDAPNSPATAPAGALGLSASIQRLRIEEAQAHADYEQAKAAGNASVAALKAKAWLSLTEALRRVEQSTPDIQAATGKTVRLDELQGVLNEFLVRLRQDLETLPTRIALELVGKDEIGIREVLAIETEAIIAALYGCQYLKGADLE